MRYKQKNKFILMFCIIALSFSLLLLIPTYIASANTQILSIFDTYGIDVKCASPVPENLGIKDNRKGVLFTSEKNGSKVEFNNSFVGDFEIDFRVFSDSTFDGTPTSLIYKNDALDLQTLRFRFTNKDGKNFSVIMFGGASGQLSSPNVCVEYEGKRAGIYYDKFGKVTGTSKFSSENSIYTLITGTSFCNYANVEEGYSTTDCASTILRFNPETMSIYSYGKGFSEKLVWSFSEKINDGYDFGCTLDCFEDYKVEMVFESIANGKTGKLIVNEVNGTALNWYYLNNEKVSLFANLKTMGVVGEKYILPVCLNSTISGKSNSNYSVEVFDANKNAVTVLDNGFTPLESGKYSIVYTVDGISKEYEIEVFDTDKQAIFDVKKTPSFSQCGVGSQINISSAKYSSKKLYGSVERFALVSVFENDVALEGYNKVSAQKDLSFVADKEGTYSVVYYADVEGVVGTKEFSYSVTSNLPVFDFVRIEPKTYIGEIIKVPTVKAKLGDNEYSTKTYITDPDGNVYINNMFEVKKAGKHVVEYRFSHNGQDYSLSNEVWALLRASDMFDTQSCSIETASYYMNDQVSGAVVTIDNENNKVTFKNEIDFSDKTGIVPIISLIITPENQGVRDFNKLSVVLEDTEDNSKNVTYQIIPGELRGGNVKSIGVTGGTGATQPQWITLYSTFSANYLSTHGTVGDTVITLGFDYSSKTLYARTNAENKFIKIVSLGNTWKGFSGDIATLNLYANGLQVGLAKYMITATMGIDLSGESISNDGVKPTVCIDYCGFEKDNLPVGVAKTPYPVFNAISYDLLGNSCEVQTRVYRNYGETNMYEAYSQNGSFTPSESGLYTVEIKATDSNGNVSVETYDVTVLENKVDYTIQENAFNLSATVGSFYNFGSFSVAENSVGVSYEVEVYLGEQKIDVLENGFKPIKGGNYTVKLIAKDFLGYKSIKEISVDVTTEQFPVFDEEICLQYAFVNGNTYTLPEVVAYDYYSNENEPKKANISYSIIFDAEPISVARTFTLNAPVGEENAVVRFTAESESKTNYVDVPVKIINARLADKKIDFSKLFTADKTVNVQAKENSIFYGVSEDTKLYFVNPVNVENLDFKFNVVEQFNNFEKLTIRLEDYENSKIAVEFEISKNKANEDTCKIKCGSENGEIIGSFFDNINQEFLISYENSNLSLKCAEGKFVFNVVSTVDGKKFNGFPSQIARLSVSLTQVSGQAGIDVYSLNSRSFIQSALDRIKPTIVVANDVKTIFSEHENCVIPSAKAVDVVDGLLSTTVTLKCKGVYVSAKDGTVLNNVDASVSYEIENLACGSYMLTYSAKDFSGNAISVTLLFDVRDFEKPTLTLKSEIPNSAKVGDTVLLSNFEVNDNGGAGNVQTTVFLVDSKYDMTVLKPNENGEIYVTYKASGVYTIRYYLVDQFYNSTYYDYEVTVK